MTDDPIMARASPWDRGQLNARPVHRQ